MSERLQQFFGGYFHQDWALEHADWRQQAASALEGGRAEGISDLIADMDSLLASGLNDDELLRKLHEELWCDFEPHGLGMSATVWVREVRGILVGGSLREPSEIDSRWFIKRHEDGPVETAYLSDRRPFLYRSLWVHDALVLDPLTRTASYRDQRDTVSDDPIDWASSPVVLRRDSQRWQARVDETTWNRWMQDQESIVEGSKEFAERYPGRVATERVDEANARLSVLRAIGFGWVDVASDVSTALDEHFGTAEKLHIANPDIIDWYDGVISALVDVGDPGEPHLCLALAWSPDYDVRVYGLVPISRAVAGSLREDLGKSPDKLTWNDITPRLTEVEGLYAGLVAVIATESVGKEVLGQVWIPSAEIPELRSHKSRMEHTIDDARLLAWLERMGVPRPLSWPEKDALHSADGDDP